MIAARGWSDRKLRSNSHASTTNSSPWPAHQLPPSCGCCPPRRTVGSRPAARQTLASIAAVEVLPWVPATARPKLVSRRRPRNCAYLRTSTPRRRDSSSSGFVGETAAECTTSPTSAGRFSRRWPTSTEIPARPKRAVGSRCASEPVTRTPRAVRICASPLVALPFTPTMWIESGSGTEVAAIGRSG